MDNTNIDYSKMSRDVLIRLLGERDREIERTAEYANAIADINKKNTKELLEKRKENREYVAIYREMDSEIVRLRTEKANLLKQVREIQDKYERALSTGDHYSECLRKAEERSFELENENDKLADENEKLNGQIESIKKVVAW